MQSRDQIRGAQRGNQGGKIGITGSDGNDVGGRRGRGRRFLRGDQIGEENAGDAGTGQTEERKSVFAHDDSNWKRESS